MSTFEGCNYSEDNLLNACLVADVIVVKIGLLHDFACQTCDLIPFNWEGQQKKSLEKTVGRYNRCDKIGAPHARPCKTPSND